VKEENVKIICATIIVVALLVIASCTVNEITSKRAPILSGSVEQDCASHLWTNDYCKALAEKVRK